MAHATISVNGEKLRHRPAALPPELLQRLRVHKAAIISLLQGGYNPHNSDSKYLMLERLGIGDDLGMPTHIGSPAWMIAVGESMASRYCGCTNDGTKVEVTVVDSESTHTKGR